MARPGIKNWWAKTLPETVERSTFVLLSSLLLELLFLQWRPMPGVVWNIENAVGQIILQGLFWGGWLLVFVSTFMIDHFELFGLRQAYLYLRDKKDVPKEFRTPALYKYVRHPLYVGWIIAFWATPRMSVGHLVFAVGTATYILIAIQLEERDLVGVFGETYEEYQQRVPMLLPISKRKKKEMQSSAHSTQTPR